MKRFLVALLFIFLLASQAQAAITAFGAASSPADNGSQDGSTTRSVTPPATMLVNDYALLIAVITDANAANALTISADGGQTWTSETQLDSVPTGGTDPTANVHTRLFHCRFNGTWGADPSVARATSTGNAFTLVMLVFRGVNTTTAIDVSPVSASYNADATVVIPEITTNTANALAVTFFVSKDDNTWTMNTGGWSQQHTQIRNTAGIDNSASHMYKIQAAAGLTGDVQNDQATLSPDGGHTWILALKEQAATAATFPQVIIVE